MEVTSPPIDNRAKDWIGVWNPVSSSPIYGKIVEKNAPALHITVQHWTPNPVFSTTDFPVLQLCTGCTLSTNPHSTYCSFLTTAPLTVALKRTSKIDDFTRQLSTPLFESDQIIQNHYEFFTNIISYNILSPSPHIIPSDFIL